MLNILFYSKDLDNSLHSLIKKTKLKNRKNVIEYISKNYDYFDRRKMVFVAKAVGITDITFTETNLVFVRADIYGQHYLLTFDINDNYMFLSKKSLWIY